MSDAVKRRALAEVNADHQPRTLERGRIRGEREARISRADEQAITDSIRRREATSKQAARTALAADATKIAGRVQGLRDALRGNQVSTRVERNIARRIAHDLDTLTAMLTETSEPGVHL